jgi:hypothetical protein
MSKAQRRQITVGKTKVAKAPWEEDRYIYDVKVGNDSLFDSNIYIALIQVIVGIAVFIWAYNVQG